MVVYIDNKELEKLYLTGKSKKLSLPKYIIENFLATIQKIEAATNINDLLADRGLRFKKLQGSNNRYSVRLNDKYRLEMEVEWINENQTIGKFYLQEISNHYSD